MTSDFISEWKSGFPETPCGKGSRVENTELIREIIPEVVRKYEIGTIADVGCGDQNWIHRCLPGGIEYTGFDIKPRSRGVFQFDVTSQTLPLRYDLVLCICVLNHFKMESLKHRACKLLQESRSEYILMSYIVDWDEAIIPFELVENWDLAQKRRLTWKYGLWRMN
jgi:hypothetical protein